MYRNCNPNFGIHLVETDSSLFYITFS